MNQQKRVWVIPTIVVFALFEFFLDTLTPLGVADYILYFLPVVLSVLCLTPVLPILTAAFSTVLIAFGFYFSPAGTTETIGFINRLFAVLAIWVVAFMVKRIIVTRIEVEEHNWVQTGQADMASKVRGELDPKEIGDFILGYLADYAKIKAGALYLVNEKTKDLDFTAGHAFLPSAEKFKIKLGDGLLGQCAQDAKPKLIHRLETNYLKLTSSLGEALAQSLVIYPLMANGKVIGVIELALEQEGTDPLLKLLDHVFEPLGVAIKSARSRDKEGLLLSQSQTLAEELQAQQEELRVSNEELEQQARALKESQVRLENQQAELEQSNQQLEEQAQFLENQKLVMEEKNRLLQITQLTLEEKSKEIERASQYKSEFLANMSHELRTPLNSTLILAKLLSENKPGTMTAEQKKFADIIYSSGNDLLNLINDILDLSKVEAGKMTVSPEVVDFTSISQSLDSMFRANAQMKKLEFKIEVEANIPKSLITDRQRLEQILKNFLSNSFKFTEKGFIVLKIFRSGPGVSFSVSDSGIGIPSKQLGVIFEAFRQADGTSNRKYGGTGLGLSISQELSQLLDGDIKVQSTEGQGSTFTLTIPLELIVKQEKPIEVTKSTSHFEDTPARPMETTPASVLQFSFTDDRETLTKQARKILIIEDDETFARILFDLAHEMNFGALVAPTAEEGLRLAHRFYPHAVLLDMRLPDHNGLIVLDQLKTNPKTRHIPVHVISSSDFSKSAMEMGAVGYLSKPVKREQLLAAFESLKSIMSQKEKRVLVVEDEEVQRDHIVELITDSFTTVDAVATAMAALEKLAEKTYDCMIMDLSLPDLSGYELLAKLSNESHRYSYPPVIVYTARDLTQSEEEKLRQYSGSIIIKGAKSPDRLLSEVTLFLHRVETELPPERQKMLKDLRSRERTLEDKNILVVDDDVRNIFALTSALETYGAKIIVARNGREALDKIMTTDNLDIVLMDIMMPEMDGYEAMRKLRQHKKYEKLPVIALTAKVMKDDQEKCLAAGANDYLPKPIDMDKLLSLIRVWLPNQRSFLN